MRVMVIIGKLIAAWEKRWETAAQTLLVDARVFFLLVDARVFFLLVDARVFFY
jgi:hypothetical protein